MKNIKKTIAIITLLTMSLTVSVQASTLTEIVGDKPTITTVNDKATNLVDYTAEKFSDTYKTAWYMPQVAKLVGLGGINGYPDGTFRPENNITVAEFIKSLLKSMGYEPVNITVATGTKANWYDGYVAKAKELGVIEATDNYNYDAAAVRKDMAKIICKALKITPKKAETQVFTDVSSIDTSFIDSAFSEFLIRGYYGNRTRTFKPESTATRAEAATMEINAIEYLNDPAKYRVAKQAYYEDVEKKQDIADAAKAEKVNTIFDAQYKYINGQKYIDAGGGYKKVEKSIAGMGYSVPMNSDYAEASATMIYCTSQQNIEQQWEELHFFLKSKFGQVAADEVMAYIKQKTSASNGYTRGEEKEFVYNGYSIYASADDGSYAAGITIFKN